MIERLDKDGKVTEAFYQYALECCRKGVEVWVDLDGKYNQVYQISNMGNVRNKKTGKLRVLCPNRQGYLIVVLSVGGVHETVRINRLVGIYYIPNPENKPEVNHETGIKAINLVTALNWTTQSENTIHAYKTGLMRYNHAMEGRLGKDNPKSKPVNQYDLNGNFIRQFDGVTEAERQTGVHNPNICRCIKGKRPTAGGYKWAYPIAV